MASFALPSAAIDNNIPRLTVTARQDRKLSAIFMSPPVV
jgi:hypothetical protein